MKELWKLLIEAQSSRDGVAQTLIEEKKNELKKEKEKIQNDLKRLDEMSKFLELYQNTKNHETGHLDSNRARNHHERRNGDDEDAKGRGHSGRDQKKASLIPGEQPMVQLPPLSSTSALPSENSNKEALKLSALPSQINSGFKPLPPPLNPANNSSETPPLSEFVPKYQEPAEIYQSQYEKGETTARFVAGGGRIRGFSNNPLGIPDHLLNAEGTGLKAITDKLNSVQKRPEADQKRSRSKDKKPRRRNKRASSNESSSSFSKDDRAKSRKQKNMRSRSRSNSRRKRREHHRRRRSRTSERSRRHRHDQKERRKKERYRSESEEKKKPQKRNKGKAERRKRRRGDSSGKSQEEESSFSGSKSIQKSSRTPSSDGESRSSSRHSQPESRNIQLEQEGVQNSSGGTREKNKRKNEHQTKEHHDERRKKEEKDKRENTKKEKKTSSMQIEKELKPARHRDKERIREARKEEKSSSSSSRSASSSSSSSGY